MSCRTFLALLAFSGLVYSSVIDEGDQFRIISGRRATTLEFPYAAQIEKHDAHWCEGAIVHKFFVVSAAHCFFKGNLTEPVDLFKVRVGNDELLKGGTLYSIKKIHIHEKFNKLSEIDKYDICLLQLAQPIKFNDRVQPVGLTEAAPKPGTMGWVVGFGKTHENKPAYSKYLMAVELPVVDLEKCKEILKVPVASDVLCAGTEKSTGDACKGDSGGPYVVNNRLAGVVIWGIGCGRVGIPGAYTNVALYKKWAESKIVENFKPEINKKKKPSDEEDESSIRRRRSWYYDFEKYVHSLNCV